MSEEKLPHVEDLATNAKLPGQLTEDMRAIQHYINDLYGQIDQLKKKKQADDDFMKHLYD